MDPVKHTYIAHVRIGVYLYVDTHMDGWTNYKCNYSEFICNIDVVCHDTLIVTRL